MTGTVAPRPLPLDDELRGGPTAAVPEATPTALLLLASLCALGLARRVRAWRTR
jgi:hypothetical protein